MKDAKELLEEANKFDEGYDLDKDIETIAEYAKTHDMTTIIHKDSKFVYLNSVIKRLDDIPRRIAIYLIRSLNTMRIRGVFDEFVHVVFTNTGTPWSLIESLVGELKGEEARKEVQRERERLEKIPILQNLDIGNIYDFFATFVDYFFESIIPAKFFVDEPELKMKDTVFETFIPEIDPGNIKRIEDSPKKDIIRLLRVVNSFRRKDIVDKFLADIGDFEDLYDLFYLFVGYVFQEYRSANYFLDEPELSTDPKYIPWQTTMFGPIYKLQTSKYQ